MTRAVVQASSEPYFYLRYLIGAMLLAGATLIAIEIFALDRRLSGYFFDLASRQFPLREHWFLERVVHIGFKYAVVALALGVLLAWGASYSAGALAPYRRALLFVFLSMLLASSAVSVLKSVSGKHCPYELQEYGGAVPFTGLLAPSPAGVKPGKCWPGGHASSGFCLFGFYFAAMWMGRCQLARTALAAALLLGFGVGMGRIMQGAHFLSHNVWSALVCWTVALSLYEAMLRRRMPPRGG